MKTIKRSSDLIDKLITHIFPLSRVEDAFKLQMTGKCGKVLLHPWEWSNSMVADQELLNIIEYWQELENIWEIENGFIESPLLWLS